MKLDHYLLPLLKRHLQPSFFRCLALLHKGLQLRVVHGSVLSELGLIEEIFNDYFLPLGERVKQTTSVPEHTKDILYT